MITYYKHRLELASLTHTFVAAYMPHGMGTVAKITDGLGRSLNVSDLRALAAQLSTEHRTDLTVRRTLALPTGCEVAVCYRNTREVIGTLYVSFKTGVA